MVEVILFGVVEIGVHRAGHLIAAVFAGEVVTVGDAADMTEVGGEALTEAVAEGLIGVAVVVLIVVAVSIAVVVRTAAAVVAVFGTVIGTVAIHEIAIVHAVIEIEIAAAVVLAVVAISAVVGVVAAVTFVVAVEVAVTADAVEAVFHVIAAEAVDLIAIAEEDLATEATVVGEVDLKTAHETATHHHHRVMPADTQTEIAVPIAAGAAAIMIGGMHIGDHHRHAVPARHRAMTRIDDRVVAAQINFSTFLFTFLCLCFIIIHES